MWIYPERHYTEIVSDLGRRPGLSGTDLQYIQLIHSRASRIEWDKRGRIRLPERLTEHFLLPAQVTLIGVRDHLELWDRAEWRSWSQSLRS